MEQPSKRQLFYYKDLFIIHPLHTWEYTALPLSWSWVAFNLCFLQVHLCSWVGGTPWGWMPSHHLFLLEACCIPCCTLWVWHSLSWFWQNIPATNICYGVLQERLEEPWGSQDGNSIMLRQFFFVHSSETTGKKKGPLQGCSASSLYSPGDPSIVAFNSCPAAQQSFCLPVEPT